MKIRPQLWGSLCHITENLTSTQWMASMLRPWMSRMGVQDPGLAGLHTNEQVLLETQEHLGGANAHWRVLFLTPCAMLYAVNFITLYEAIYNLYKKCPGEAKRISSVINWHFLKIKAGLCRLLQYPHVPPRSPRGCTGQIPKQWEAAGMQGRAWVYSQFQGSLGSKRNTCQKCAKTTHFTKSGIYSEIPHWSELISGWRSPVLSEVKCLSVRWALREMSFPFTPHEAIRASRVA